MFWEFLRVPPVTFPRADAIQKITLPEDVYIKKFFKKHPDSKHEDAIKYGLSLFFVAVLGVHVPLHFMCYQSLSVWANEFWSHYKWGVFIIYPWQTNVISISELNMLCESERHINLLSENTRHSNIAIMFEQVFCFWSSSSPYIWFEGAWVERPRGFWAGGNGSSWCMYSRFLSLTVFAFLSCF